MAKIKAVFGETKITKDFGFVQKNFYVVEAQRKQFLCAGTSDGQNGVEVLKVKDLETGEVFLSSRKIRNKELADQVDEVIAPRLKEEQELLIQRNLERLKEELKRKAAGL